MRKSSSLLSSAIYTLSYYLLLTTNASNSVAAEKSIGICPTSFIVGCGDGTSVYSFTFIDTTNLTEAEDIYLNNPIPEKENICNINETPCENYEKLPTETRDYLERGEYGAMLCDPIRETHPVSGAKGPVEGVKRAVNIFEDGKNSRYIEELKFSKKFGWYFFCDKELNPTESSEEEASHNFSPACPYQ